MSSNFYKPLRAIFLAGFLSQSVVVFAADTKAPDSAKNVKAVLTVNTLKPTYAQWSETQLANGSVSSWQDAVIASEIGGLRITQLLVDVGSEVKRGQKLAQLSQDMVRVDVAQKQALVAQANAELAEATANAKRVEEAKGGNAFSEQQSTQYLIAQDKARANLDSAEAQLKAQKIRLQQTDIVAVDDGVISARNANLGAVVQVGTELFRMVRQNRLEWRAELMAEQLMSVRRGQKVKLTLPSGEEVEGSVRVTAPTLDTTTRKGMVYVDLPVSASAYAGMFARGEILLGKKQALTVPQTALVLRDGFAYVFEVSDDQHVVQRKVATGRRGDNRVEILSGLRDDATIVASGGAFLNSGDVISIAEVDMSAAAKGIQ